MNKIWLLVLIFSMGTLLIHSPSDALSALSIGANKAVTLSLELCAIYAVWSGIMKILEETGIANKLCKLLSPVIDFLFGKNLTTEAKQYISLNMSANILGMGGAATPMGIKAIQAMDDKKPKATPEMIMLVVLASSSLQLIPTSIIGLLSDNGSSNPTSIIVPSLISSFASTFVGVVLVKICQLFSKSKKVSNSTLQKKNKKFSFKRQK